MKFIITISFIALCSFAHAQKAFTPGSYSVGDEVLYNGKVYVNSIACKTCKAAPANNRYWVEKTKPTLSIDSLLKRIEAIEMRLKKDIPSFTAESKDVRIDTVKKVIYY